MTELSAYKKNLKPTILKEAMNNFREYGIRAVKMDDIAKNMGISKRTLYEVYSNKEDLLVDVVKCMLKQRDEYMKNYTSNCRDTIDILLEVLRLQIEFSVSTHADFFKDLQRYPAAEKQLEQFHKGQQQEAKDFFQNGVNQGFFRSNVDYSIFLKITSGVMRMIRTEKQYKNLTYQQLFLNYLCVIIRGICTLKGLERLDTFIDQHITNKIKQ